MFPSTTPSNYRKFATMKIQWICFNFDDILLERICLNMASRLKKECGENLKMFYRMFVMMDDGYKHWVIPQNGQTKCRHCHMKTTTRCEKCDVGLHVKCFKDYHSL